MKEEPQVFQVFRFHGKSYASIEVFKITHRCFMVFFFFWLTKTIAENKNMFLNKVFRIFLGNLTRFLRQALPRLAPAICGPD